ncbi:MAG: efflux RND transporter permease subunit, partial [Rhodospirillales bacterium]|nr:efflux RND transporter permease subunit [Rhodospirillales bacterium]
MGDGDENAQHVDLHHCPGPHGHRSNLRRRIGAWNRADFIRKALAVQSTEGAFMFRRIAEMALGYHSHQAPIAEFVDVPGVRVSAFVSAPGTLVIGSSLIVTILGSFILMAMFGIDLQRVSLGALVIALGMMVDNSIVVADGFVVRVQQGMDRKKAAIEAASSPSWPLLGATVVAVMAFYPIFASIEDTGEYCRTLFLVVAILLLPSWVVSMTLTPIQCLDMLPSPKPGAKAKEPYGGFFYRGFRDFLRRAIAGRWLTLGGMAALLVVAVLGFGNVKQLFFPDSAMTKFMIDVWAPEGTRIQNLAADLRRAEEKLLADERVAEVASFIGQGPPRFYLPVDPEGTNPAYAQLIVNVHDARSIDGVISDMDPWFREAYPDALIPQRKYGVGPSDTWKFEMRIIGPAVADPGQLRAAAAELESILAGSPLVAAHTTDWRQRVKKVVPAYNDERGRWASITRENVANATKRAFDGRVIGLYREDDDLIPIVLRHAAKERRNVGGLDVLQIKPTMGANTVPLSQVTDGVGTEWEDPVIARRDRRLTVTVQANPIFGVTLPTLRASLIEQIE